ncbi:hypothetical protein RhiirC2_798676 [Rhizophagus irregularis]|uniref:Uncharacterized protein n=1 Tax=Rhizophagus irregularis TaxID=588596 RepID=A0A2N1M633_9GLOM|nr:hypothetical protein RhiirC2_798676 [Rhizophagus irregularis]
MPISHIFNTSDDAFIPNIDDIDDIDNEIEEPEPSRKTASPEKEKLERDDAIVTWIIADQQPFSVVEKKNFIKMMNVFDSRYKPAGDITKGMIPK